MRRLAERRFGAAAAERLAAALAGVTDADRLAEAGESIVDCATTADFLARVGRVRLDDDLAVIGQTTIRRILKCDL